LQGHYQAGDSILHQMDGRAKVPVALVLILGIVLTPERAWFAYPLLWAIPGVLAAISGIGAGRLARMGGLALPFTLAAVTLLFTIPGQPIVSFLGLTITEAGLARFVSIVLKSWLAVQVALLLSMTTTFTDLLAAFRWLRVPGTLVEIISFMYRYLFTLQEEAKRLMQARASRSATNAGSKSGGSLRWRAQTAGGMIGNLFLRSYERSERVYAAMLARGYSGKIPAASLPPLSTREIAQGALPIFFLLLIEATAVLQT
jgi:cobalt/nickel transport system permease protein